MKRGILNTPESLLKVTASGPDIVADVVIEIPSLGISFHQYGLSNLTRAINILRRASDALEGQRRKS